jgi:hypothetical protein
MTNPGRGTSPLGRLTPPARRRYAGSAAPDLSDRRYVPILTKPRSKRALCVTAIAMSSLSATSPATSRNLGASRTPALRIRCSASDRVALQVHQRRPGLLDGLVRSVRAIAISTIRSWSRREKPVVSTSSTPTGRCRAPSGRRPRPEEAVAEIERSDSRASTTEAWGGEGRCGPLEVGRHRGLQTSPATSSGSAAGTRDSCRTGWSAQQARPGPPLSAVAPAF